MIVYVVTHTTDLYQKEVNPATGGKQYRPLVLVNGKQRPARDTQRTASKAQAYQARLTARYHRYTDLLRSKLIAAGSGVEPS